MPRLQQNDYLKRSEIIVNRMAKNAKSKYYGRKTTGFAPAGVPFCRGGRASPEWLER
jgi:hypothetical protein